MLEIKNLSFRYTEQSNWLFQDFNFTAEKGEIVVISGDSGSGKTTLLNIICGVIPKMIKGDFSGEINLDDTAMKDLNLPQTAPLISLLMQEPDKQLFFPTVEQELAFGPENLQIPAAEIQNRINETLIKLQIEPLRFKETHTLSFGQKKIVTFASLLTLSPRVFLLDEITVGLSAAYSEIIKNILQELKADGKTIFLTDHSGELMELADKLITLKGGSLEH